MSEILDARAAAIDWAARALAHETHHAAVDLMDLAESLVAIAEHFEIPDEAVIAWIHATADGKEWSAAEFRAWCEKFRETQSC